MTKGQQSEQGQVVRTGGFNAAVQEVLANLPLASYEEVMSGTFSVEQRAMRHDVSVGMLHAINELYRKGKVPKARQSQVQPQMLRYDNE